MFEKEAVLIKLSELFENVKGQAHKFRLKRF